MTFSDIIPIPAKMTATGGTFRAGTFNVVKTDFIKAATADLPRHAGDAVDLTIKNVPDLFANSLSDADIRKEAYRLTLDRGGVVVEAADERGAFYALKTLKALASRGELPAGVVEDWPSLKFRGAHLTLERCMPRFERFVEIVKTMADHKLNALVIEYDDRFPWAKHPELVHKNAYTLNQLQELIRVAEENFIEVVPLLDSLGHAEQYLVHQQHAHLREHPDSIHEMCPNNPATLDFMKELWEEVLALHQNSRYAHITGDEVFRLEEGLCPNCADYARRGRLGELYTKYYGDLSRWIIGQGKIPIIWGDMLLKHPDSLDSFPRDVVINDWTYNGADVDQWDFPYYRKGPDGQVTPERDALFAASWASPEPGKFRPFPTTKFFVDKGFTVIGATAASDGQMEYPVTALRERFLNNKNFAKALKTADADGMIVTFWTGVSPFEGAWFGVLAGADFAWNVREESFPRFAARFSAAFLGQDESLASTLVALDAELFGLNGPVGGEIQVANPSGGGYLELLGLSAELGALDAQTKRLREQAFGGGDGQAIPLGAAANSSSADCMPPTAPFFQFPRGTIRVGGTKFLVEDKYLSSSGPLRDVPVDGCFEAVAALTTCHSAPAGAEVARMFFRYADGSESPVEFTSGVNTHDWWGCPKALAEGVAAFTVQVEYQSRVSAYAALITNPFPAKKLVSLRFEPLSGSARLVVLALTGIVALDAPKAASAEGLEQRLMQLEDKLLKTYSGITQEDEAAEAVKKIFAGRLAAVKSIDKGVRGHAEKFHTR